MKEGNRACIVVDEIHECRGDFLFYVSLRELGRFVLDFGGRVQVILMSVRGPAELPTELGVQAIFSSLPSL